MANTLKFGNGQWATGNGTALAYNDENANFKPLPFDFTRASSGTTVNQSGLIETVGSGLPRIDFQGNTKGALLLEPSRTNLITYSEDFSQSVWVKSGTSVVSGFASPSADSPLGAFKLVENTANSAHTITSNAGSVTSGATTTKSIIVKPNGRRWILLLDIYKPSSRAWFDLELGVVGSLQPSAISSSIEKLNNGYFRCSVASAVNGTSSQLRMDIVEGNNITSGYQGNGTSGVYIFGAQLEAGSYPTSYIPTSGSAVTRVAETCSQTVPDGVIGQTEGTLFMNFNIDVTSNFKHILNIKNSTNSERVIVYVRNTNLLRYQYPNGTYDEGSTLSSGNHKIAITYSGSNISFFRDGIKLTTNTNFAKTVTFSEISIGNYLNIDQLGNVVNQSLFYNNALTDAQAIALTTI